MSAEPFTVRLRHVAAVAAVALAGLVVPAVAHADYTETFCDNSPPPPYTEGSATASPWTEIADTCAQGGVGDYQLGIGTDVLPGGSAYAASLDAPTDETFTAVNLAFSFNPWTGGGQPSIELGYGDGTFQYYMNVPTATAAKTFSTALPDATSIYAEELCPSGASQGCDVSFPQGTLQLGPMTITLHDTTSPSVSVTGGSLSSGTVSGTQSVGYSASAAGSGVAAVSVSLGSTVVGTTQSACQSPSLTPCPASVSGLVLADTTKVPDGTYPVTLTASNMSGNTASAPVGEVTVDNTPAVTPAPPTTTSTGSHAKKRQLRIVIDFTWKPLSSATFLKFVTIPGSVNKKAELTFTCVGRKCPFTSLKTDGRHVAKLIHKLHHRRFGDGDKLIFVGTAPHRTAERALIAMRPGRVPRITQNVSAARVAKLEKQLHRTTPKHKQPKKHKQN